jgi:hypothetical protein
VFTPEVLQIHLPRDIMRIEIKSGSRHSWRYSADDYLGRNRSAVSSHSRDFILVAEGFDLILLLHVPAAAKEGIKAFLKKRWPEFKK